MLKIVLIFALFVACNLYCLGQQESSQANSIAQELAVLTTPKPNYTDRARQNKVKGWVRLRVAFLASGEIGEVIYLAESSKKKKKLTKYGLVEMAILAAKKIKFTPATDENGNPVIVTKEIEYTFDIY